MSWQAVLIGLAIALFFYECPRLSPGGLLLPVYLAMSASEPGRLLMTLAAMLLTWAVLRLLSPHVLLYGRRRWALAVLVCCLWGAALSGFSSTGDAWALAGYALPGLGVRDMERQGVLKTLLSLAAVSALTWLALSLAGLL